MHLLLGIGNEMNGDDAIGIWIARNFSCNGWVPIDCATVPENCIGEIKKYNAEKIVLVDAADMGLSAGEIRVIPKEKIGLASFSTHSVPLSVFISHLEEMGIKDIILIGIQPKTFYGEMSEEVRRAGEKLMDILKEGKIEEIEKIE